MGNIALEQLQTLLIVLVVLIFVVLAGLILYIVLSSRQKTRRRRVEYGGTMSASSPALAPTGRHPITLTRNASGLQVDISGVTYRTLTEIKDPEFRRQVILAAMDLVRFTGVLDQAAASPAPMDRTYRWREDVRQESQGELAQIQTSVSETPVARPVNRDNIEQEFLDLLSQMGQTPPAEKPSLMGALERTRRPKLPEERPRSFVDDIEDIIQRRIRLIPAFHERELHVRADPGGAVRFDFDGTEYRDLDDIPNMTARQLIADAIKEWEETT